MKKIIYYFMLIIFLISCDAQVARSQFERGEYRESVRTTASYISNGQFSKLKLADKEEVLSRLRHIEDYYQKNIDSSLSINNIKNIYDLFIIQQILTTVPEIREDFNYINYRLTNKTISDFDYLVNRKFRENISLYEIEKLAEISYDMKKINMKNGQYIDIYKSLARNLADKYYEIYEYERDLNKKLEYIQKVSNIYSDFDRNYKGSLDKYNKLKKQIEISKANKYYEEAKNQYFYEDYEKAIENFKKAEKIYLEYFDYNSEARDVRVYLENATTKYNNKQAEIYYRRANEYVAKKDYKNAVANYYQAHKFVNNYKGSYNLAKEYENKANNKISYYVTSNNATRKNYIQRYLEQNGYTSNKYNSRVIIDYYEEVFYTQENISVGIVREVLRVRPLISAGTYQQNVKDLVYVNEYNRYFDEALGKDRMLKLNETKINLEIEKIIRNIVK